MRLRSEGVTWQEIEGELVILDVVSSSYLTTNESGAFMTKLLTQERTVEDLVQALVEVRSPAHLLDTPFGRAVLVKIVLLGLLVGLGALQRRRSVPGLRAAAKGGASPGAAGVLLRRALRAELALVVVVLAGKFFTGSYLWEQDLTSGLRFLAYVRRLTLWCVCG